METYKILAITVALFSLLISGCAHHKKSLNDTASLKKGLIKTANIMQKDKARFAILLRNDCEITVVGIDKGKRAIRREEPSTMSLRSSGENNRQLQPNKDICKPRSDIKTAKKGDILYKKTIEVIVRKGSLCLDTSVGETTDSMCSPEEGEYPEGLIRLLMAQ